MMQLPGADPGRTLLTEDCHCVNRLCPNRTRSNRTPPAFGIRPAARHARHWLSTGGSSHPSAKKQAPAAPPLEPCVRPLTVRVQRRAGAEAAVSGLVLAARFATCAGGRPRSRRTEPEAATSGLALAARFALGAGLRIFLLDLRAIVFPLLFGLCRFPHPGSTYRPTRGWEPSSARGRNEGCGKRVVVPAG